MHIEQIPPYLTWKIRHRVMYPNLDFSVVILPEDDDGVHLGLFDENKLISVVSTFVTGDTMQFRKFATLDEYQGRGYGSELLTYVLTYAESLHLRHIWCNARVSAVAFYQKFGFTATDKTSDNHGISYVIMQKNLSTPAVS